MYSPQIAGWRQNCSVWTSHIIIHHLLPQRRLMSKCIQTILCVAVLHSQEGNSSKVHEEEDGERTDGRFEEDQDSLEYDLFD